MRRWLRQMRANSSGGAIPPAQAGAVLPHHPGGGRIAAMIASDVGIAVGAQLPAVPEAVRQQVARVLATLPAQIAAAQAMIRQQAQATVTLAAQVARVQTMTGVGLLTAAVVVAETRPLRGAAHGRAIVSDAGLDPAPSDSGTSVHRARQSSKKGNARLRQAVSMAALAAARHNPVLRPFSQRLRARGKRPRVALVAVARQLLALMATLLIHERDFDPEWQTRSAPAHS
jgi:transposase